MCQRTQNYSVTCTHGNGTDCLHNDKTKVEYCLTWLLVIWSAWMLWFDAVSMLHFTMHMYGAYLQNDCNAAQTACGCKPKQVTHVGANWISWAKCGYSRIYLISLSMPYWIETHIQNCVLYHELWITMVLRMWCGMSVWLSCNFEHFFYGLT